MKRRVQLFWLLALLVLAVSSAAMAQAPIVDLSPYPSMYQGEIIEVPPGDIEDLWFHINLPDGYYHVDNWSFHYDSSDPVGGWVELLQVDVQPSIEYRSSQWYKFGTIQVNGRPSTTFQIQIDLTLPQPWGNQWSNPIIKHITPEPSSMLALGTGLLGVGGLILKRRRS